MGFIIELLEGESSSPTWVHVFVKFSDSETACILYKLENLLGKEDYPGIEPQLYNKFFLLLSDLTKRSIVIKSKIKSLIGKQVFATSNSDLYPISSTLLELIGKKNKVERFSNLEPMTITVAKYNEEADVIVIKLKTEDGKEYLTLSNYVPRRGVNSFFETAIAGWSGPDLLSNLGNYTEKEIEAIKYRKVFVGMKVIRVYEALGLPDNSDYGIMIYSNGKLRIQINEKARMVTSIEDDR